MAPAEGGESIRTEAKGSVDTLGQRIFGKGALGSVDDISLPVTWNEAGYLKIFVFLVYYVRSKADIQKVRGDMKAALEFQVEPASVPGDAIIFAIGKLAVDRT